MNTEYLHDFTSSLTGPDLLLQNAFRLAQMPVDTTERNLNRRQKMIETAAQLGMSPSQGECPLLIVPHAVNQENLKEALHRLRDPINRLLDELFWFWPSTFGDSGTDTGLHLLKQGQTQKAMDLWKQGEREPDNIVAVHNLALLHQFVALHIDLHLIGAMELSGIDLDALVGFQVKKDEKTSSKHWQESLSRWNNLLKQEVFWGFLTSRIDAINDPRLPRAAVHWLRENIVSIFLSINASLIVNAAEKQLTTQVQRQNRIIRDSAFNAEQIESVFETLTNKYVRNIQYLCKSAEDVANHEPAKADTAARHLAKQAEPILQTLTMVFPKINTSVSAAYDQVAEAIRLCQVKFGRKTENWAVSIDLLQIALPLTRSETTRSKIDDDLNAVKDLLAQNDNWCLEGYFDLPKECIDLLEEARRYDDTGQLKEAVEVLRPALLGLLDLPSHPHFYKQLCHCLAYSFKHKGITIFNQAITEFNYNYDKTSVDSLECDGYIGEGFGMCAGCKRSISGSYVNRTIKGHAFPFCMSCSNELDRKIQVFDGVLSKVKMESLELMVLANAFDPGFGAVTRNLDKIRKTDQDSKIQDPDPNQLKRKWNLLGPEALVEQLAQSTDSEAATLFADLTKMINKQSESSQAAILGRLFTAALEDNGTIDRLLPLLQADQFILSKFEIFGLHAADTPACHHGKRFMVYLLGSRDEQIREHALQGLLDSPEEAADLVLSACETANKKQGDQLCRFISTIGKRQGLNGCKSMQPSHILKYILPKARLPEVSNALFQYCEALDPDYDQKIMDKRTLRTLKYMELSGTEQQRSVSGHILDKMRSRGTWSRFKVWLWRPATEVQESPQGQQVWWSRNN
jgi:hypothetical protein